MVFSLFAYFFSMVTGFMAIMAILIGLGDSQMRTTPLPHYPIVSIAETTPAPQPAKIAEQDKPEEAQKPVQAKEDIKKIARAKLARERKRVMLARQRQQREEREDALALGYANQPFNTPTFPAFGQRGAC